MTVTSSTSLLGTEPLWNVPGPSSRTFTITDVPDPPPSRSPAARPPPPAASRFSLLGPLEVSSGRQKSTPRPLKVRIVLAALLVSRNSVVSTDALIRELWEEAPPRTALAALRVYVSQLRRVLSELGGRDRPHLVTQQPGYRLEIDPDHLDAVEFDRLCERGRRHGSEQDFEPATRHYRQALELWRGPALSDVRGGPLLESAALQFEESRLAALTRRVDLDLRLGQHHDLLPELTALATEHALNEELQARLMIALCRSGRTNEALGVYSRVRRLLVEQLDMEPDQELQRVHRAVLSSDHQMFELVDMWAA